MDEYKTIFAIYFLIAILIPPQKNWGVKGFMNDWDRYIEKPVKRLSPPKLIQFRYKISNAPINIITYLTFLVDFAFWVMLIVMVPCLLFLKGKLLDTVFIIFAIVCFLINLPIGIVRTVCTSKIAKKQKVKLHTEQYVAMRSLAETLVVYRKAKREHKRTQIMLSFSNDFERCLKMKKASYILPEDNLKWVTNKILPKYKKHLTYSILREDHKNKLLTVCWIDSNEAIIQVSIKK